MAGERSHKTIFWGGIGWEIEGKRMRPRELEGNRKAKMGGDEKANFWGTIPNEKGKRTGNNRNSSRGGDECIEDDLELENRRPY
jgi:hypothetical protein